MAKSEPEPKQYTALVALTNDATGKAFKPGATVTPDDFSEAVIKNWLKIGALEVKAVEAKKEGVK